MKQSSMLEKAEFGLRRGYGLARRQLQRAQKRALFVRDLREFISQLPADVRERFLTRMDPGRVISLLHFHSFVDQTALRVDRVAVVSGSPSEPELLFLAGTPAVDFLSFNDNPELFDLNKDWSGEAWARFRGAYDLVLCEQVLEHLADPQFALRNLSLLLARRGILHVSVPSVNNYHGEPHYWYAGFATEALSSWMRDAGLDDIQAASWSSKKGARMYSTSDWAPLAESGPSGFFFWSLKVARPLGAEWLRLSVRRLRNFFLYPFQPLFAISPTKAAVVSWAFGAQTRAK